jgi:fused signal recognition particle receptor
MFGLLKKKFKDLSDKILGKSKEKIDSEDQSQEETSSDTSKTLDVPDEKSPVSKEPISNSEEISVPKVEDVKEDISTPKVDDVKEDISTPKVKDVKEEISIPKVEDSKKEKTFSKVEIPFPEVEKSIPEVEDVKEEIFTPKVEDSKEEIPTPKTEETKEEKPILKEEIKEDKQPSKAYTDLESKKVEDVKKTTFTKIKSLFSSKIKLSEKEISEFLDDFEISLLEADVSIDSSTAIIEDLKKRLVNASFSKTNILEDIKKNIKETLKEQLNIDCDINNYISQKQNEPLIILIIGPNGAGKTTTISKFANLYKNQGKSVVLASSDTFRAGSIDQLEVHAKRLGVRVVKQNYGSDPAAVAFDAVASAKANKNDVVLIDTAGRQDTNINLMQELSKIKRVVKPDLTIYIGESQSGQTIVEQIQKFDKEIGVTGVILTKIDTDPKGGVAISILNELKKPIFYIGTGQEYNDIEKFSPEYIIERIV